MRKSTLSLAVLLACLCLTSCAPVIVGRTPQPAAVGESEFSINAGYNVFNSYSRTNDIYIEVAQFPTAHPLNLFLARGVGGNTEVNGTLSFSLNPSLRLGGKTLLIGEAVPVAVDYGISLLPLELADGVTLSSIGLDAGLLFSYPQPGVEPYGALRGFMGSASYATTYQPRLSGALTAGADLPLGSGSFFAELTVSTTTFSGGESFDPPPPPIGFSIVPAVGYRF